MTFIVPPRLTMRPFSTDPNGRSERQAKLCRPDKGRWRRGWDSNPRYGFSPYNGLANRRLQPLGHPSTDEWIDAGYAKRPLARAHQATQDGGWRTEAELAPTCTEWLGSPLGTHRNPILTRFVAIVRRSLCGPRNRRRADVVAASDLGRRFITRSRRLIALRR